MMLSEANIFPCPREYQPPKMPESIPPPSPRLPWAPSCLACLRIAALRPLSLGGWRTSRWRAVCVCCMRFSICPGSVIMTEQCCHRPALLGLAAKEPKPDIQAFVVLVMPWQESLNLYFLPAEAKHSWNWLGLVLVKTKRIMGLQAGLRFLSLTLILPINNCFPTDSLRVTILLLFLLSLNFHRTLPYKNQNGKEERVCVSLKIKNH